jgi:Domain of Unknown Function (DUF1080)
MKGTIVLLALVASVSYGQPAAKPKQAPDAWITLFDGRSVSGWTPEQGAKWRVSAGVLIGDAGEDGWLRSDRQFTNFLLHIEYKDSPKGNSGVFLRATKDSNFSDPSNPAGSYELQINNEDDKWATGSIENFIQRLVPVNPTPDQWHSYEVEVRGDHLVATLDGTKVLDGRDAKFKAGYIGLQHHKDNKIEFRNIRVKPLTD